MTTAAPIIRRLLGLCVLLAVLVIPFQVLSLGYLPFDDALRHVAKALSGKEWQDILVMRPECTIDQHAGWHWILRQLHVHLGLGADGLILFSVVALFYLFAAALVAGVRRPEMAVGALLAGVVAYEGLPNRLLMGRPFLFSMAVLLLLLALWTRPHLRWGRTWGWSVLLMALAAWIHGSWYLFALPVAGFLLAGWWRQGLWLGSAWLAGSLAGACLTGHPVDFLFQQLQHLQWALGQKLPASALVTEFRPSGGMFPWVALVGAVVLARWVAAGRVSWQTVWNPLFLTGLLAWVLGLRVIRFTLDWTIPCWLLWMAQELSWLAERPARQSPWRYAAGCGLMCLGLVFGMTADLGGRWTLALKTKYLESESPAQRPWLPAAGGVLYSSDMTIFYQTFYKNPQAGWRYVLGFEPGLMRADDWNIYQRIGWSGYDVEYRPWVEKMNVADRLILRMEGAAPPAIPGLEWRQVVPGVWAGRKPQPDPDRKEGNP